MTNIRKLMGRLNAPTCRFDVGRGGVPEMTTEEVSGAVGMARDKFSVEVFCAAWWPDGARLKRSELDSVIGALQFAEWRERAERLLDAQLVVAQARARKDRAAELAATARLSKAKADMWPALIDEVYGAIRSAALSELSATGHCIACAGRGTVHTGDLVAGCSACAGTGKEKTSDRARAALIHRDEAAYRRTWRPVYEWTFRCVSDAESKGAREILAHMPQCGVDASA